MKTLNAYKTLKLARLSNALDSCLSDQSTIIWLPTESEEDEEQPEKKPKKKKSKEEPLVPGFVGLKLAA